MFRSRAYRARSSAFSRSVGTRAFCAQADLAMAPADLTNPDAVIGEILRSQNPSAESVRSGLGSCVDVLKVGDCHNGTSGITMDCGRP